MRIIQSDGHGEDVWRGALAACAALRQVRDEGATRFNGFGDLLADVFHLLREPAPRWNALPWPTFHEHALRDMAELSEFRELRTLAAGDPDNTILATCILGRQLARQVSSDLLSALQAEAVGQSVGFVDQVPAIGDDGGPNPPRGAGGAGLGGQRRAAGGLRNHVRARPRSRIARGQARLGFQSYGVLIGDAAQETLLGRAIQKVVHLTELSADGSVLQALFGRQ